MTRLVHNNTHQRCTIQIPSLSVLYLTTFLFSFRLWITSENARQRTKWEISKFLQKLENQKMWNVFSNEKSVFPIVISSSSFTELSCTFGKYYLWGRDSNLRLSAKKLLQVRCLLGLTWLFEQYVDNCIVNSIVENFHCQTKVYPRPHWRSKAVNEKQRLC